MERQKAFRCRIEDRIDARVYGMSGSWTLPTNAHFVKQDGNWIQCN
ncbi:MAG: hypothetical protein IJI68_02225 [Eggerthellaceae bacterium]|nr:hypothetical protein [Eggerthellaceae bacterium]